MTEAEKSGWAEGRGGDLLVGLVVEAFERAAQRDRDNEPPQETEGEVEAFADRLFQVGLRSPESTKALLVFKEFRRAPAEPAVTDEMVDIIQESVYDDYREGDRPVIRAALEAVMALLSTGNRRE